MSVDKSRHDSPLYKGIFTPRIRTFAYRCHGAVAVKLNESVPDRLVLIQREDIFSCYSIHS